jgi:hypothetical protein
VQVEQRKRMRHESLRAASKTLAEFLERDVQARSVIEEESELPAPEAYPALIDGALARGGMAEVRLEKRRRLLQIAAFDVAGDRSKPWDGR